MRNFRFIGSLFGCANALISELARSNSDNRVHHLILPKDIQLAEIIDSWDLGNFLKADDADLKRILRRSPEASGFCKTIDISYTIDFSEYKNPQKIPTDIVSFREKLKRLEGTNTSFEFILFVPEQKWMDRYIKFHRILTKAESKSITIGSDEVASICRSSEITVHKVSPNQLISFVRGYFPGFTNFDYTESGFLPLCGDDALSITYEERKFEDWIKIRNSFGGNHQEAFEIFLNSEYEVMRILNNDGIPSPSSAAQ